MIISTLWIPHASHKHLHARCTHCATESPRPCQRDNAPMVQLSNISCIHSAHAIRPRPVCTCGDTRHTARGCHRMQTWKRTNSVSTVRCYRPTGSFWTLFNTVLQAWASARVNCCLLHCIAAQVTTTVQSPNIQLHSMTCRRPHRPNKLQPWLHLPVQLLLMCKPTRSAQQQPESTTFNCHPQAAGAAQHAAALSTNKLSTICYRYCSPYRRSHTASVNVCVLPVPPTSGVSTDLSSAMYTSTTADSSLKQQQ